MSALRLLSRSALGRCAPSLFRPSQTATSASGSGFISKRVSFQKPEFKRQIVKKMSGEAF